MSSASVRMVPLSIAPLEAGWRAVVQHGEYDEPPAIVPVLAWGVFAHSLVDGETGETLEENGNIVTGVTASNGSGTVGPFLTHLFPKFVWYYLRPGAAEPRDAAEARAERDRLQASPWESAQVVPSGEPALSPA